MLAPGAPRWFAGAALLLAACGNNSFVADEDWGDPPPELRLAVLAGGGVVTVRLLGPRDPFDIPLQPAFAAAGKASVWILGYSSADITKRLGLAPDLTPEAITSNVVPMVGELGLARTLPATERILCATIDPGSAREVSYRACSPQEWEAGGLRIGLAISGCAALPVSIQALDLPRSDRVVGLATETATVAHLLTQRDQSMSLALQRVAAMQLAETATLALTPPSVGRLSWDPKRHVVWGATKTRPFAYRPTTGRTLDVDPFPRQAPFSEHFDWGQESGVWAGSDGTVLAGVYNLYALEGRQWRLLEESPSIPIELVRVVDQRRIFFFTGCWVQSYALDDLTDPYELFADPGCVSGDGRRKLHDISADDAILVGVGETGRVAAVRAGSFDVDERDLGIRTALRVAAAVGEGRFLVGGDAGELWLWRGTQWCPIADDALTGLDLTIASTAPDRSTVYFVAQPPKDPSVPKPPPELQRLLRVSLGR